MLMRYYQKSHLVPKKMYVALCAMIGLLTVFLPNANAADTSAKATASNTKTPTRTLSVGVLAPSSGNAAASGKDMQDGWNYWFANNGTTFGAITIRTSFYDTASSPNISLTKAREAVQKNHVDILVGTLLSSSALAIVPFAAQHKIPYLIPETGADNLAQRARNKYAIKAGGWNSSQPAHVAGAWAYEQGYRKAVTIVSGYAFGYENSGGFSQVFHDAGGKILDHLFPPLGTKDFSPYLSRIRNSKPDVVFATLVGADGQNFLKQWTSFGLSKEIPLINTQTTTDQSNMREGDPSIFKGLVSVGYYAPGRDDPVTRDFVNGYAAKYGSIPDSHAASMYLTAQWLSKAVESLPANASTDQIIDAINKVSFNNTPFGPYKLDKYGGPIFNVYLMKVVPTPDSLKKYGAVWNVVERTWPNVSQFWTYNPEVYLKQPVYSESFQGY